MKKVALLILMTIFLFFACDKIIADVEYVSDKGERVEVFYKKDSVKIKFDDGTILKLTRVMSGSGVRYANSDESKVFWEHQGTGLFYVKNELIFSGKEIEKNGEKY